MSSAKDYAFRLRGLRRMTEFEVRQKLRLRHYSIEEIDEAIQACLYYGYINDDEFANDYILDAFRIKEWGRNKIFRYLLKKGIPADLIEQKIDACGIDEKEVLHRFFERKYDPASLRSWQEKQKTAASLVRRGFSYPLISELLQEDICFEENDNE